MHAAPERFFLTTFKDAANPELSVRLEGIKDFFIKHKDTLTTTEWFYNGIWFDGFWRRYCTVVEAKGNYERMFPADPGKAPFFAETTTDQWLASYLSQQAALSPAAPRARLEWHFMQERPWLAALDVNIPPEVARFTPPPSTWMSFK